MSLQRILTAEVVYNGLGTPRVDGAVVVQGQGEDAQVVMIGSRKDARRSYPDAPAIKATLVFPAVRLYSRGSKGLLPSDHLVIKVNNPFLNHMHLLLRQCHLLSTARPVTSILFIPHEALSQKFSRMIGALALIWQSS
jgi:hypothetical protein